MIYKNKIHEFANNDHFVCKFAILALHKYALLYNLTLCYFSKLPFYIIKTRINLFI